METPSTPTPIEEIKSAFLDKKRLRIFIKRDDLIHSEIMGNKWRKLKYNIQFALENNMKSLVTFGGAYSNHIAATAAAAKIYGLHSVGIIRGEELNKFSNPTLRQAHRNGMILHFTSRKEFNEFKSSLKTPFDLDDTFLILPEGGTNANAITGSAEIIEEINVDFDILTCATGTGGTFAGLVKGLKGKKYAWGFSALNGKWIQNEMKSLFSKYNVNYDNYHVFEDSYFGGYGRFKLNLIQFILDFKQEYGILLDPIYTGKMFFSVWELAKNDQIAPGSTLLMLHTGGLQGIAGFNHRFNLALPEP